LVCRVELVYNKKELTDLVVPAFVGMTRRMFMRKTIYVALIILLVLNGILLGIIFYSKRSDLKVAFLDVGQGDAILLTQGQNQVLIDGGKSEDKLLEGLGKHMPFWDRKIEVVLTTHPDIDHIGGLSELPQKYESGSLISTKAQSDSAVFEILKNNYAPDKISKIEGKLGTKIKFQEGELEILYPFSSLEEKTYKDTNGTSLVGKVIFGKNKFLLTGDMTEKQEREMLERGIDVAAQYLKVAHHGSKYSTSENFLKKVSPFLSVISVGKNNRYGHPAPETLEKLNNNNVSILRTDDAGDIVFQCSQKTLSCQREDF